MKTVKSRLSEVRGLAFIADVPVLVETKESLSERLQADLEAHESESKRADKSIAYAKLGLLPPGADLSRTSLNYYSRQVEGFYESTTKKIFLLTRKNASTKAEPLSREDADEIDMRVLVHELTHALQDQHFSLARKLRAPANGDRVLALTAVAEADALLAEYAYLFGGLQEWLPPYVRQVLQNKMRESDYSAIPAVIADKVRFQYLSGLDFLAHAISKLGWRPLNLIYDHPPLSTEQILHPEKYFSRPDPPTQIGLNNLPALVSTQWRGIENDTLGEFVIRCLFEQFMRPKKAGLIAAGWGGDRFVAFRRGDNVAFIWATTWDSARDADEFFDGYQRIVSLRYDARPLEKGQVYIERHGRTVVIVEGLGHRYVSDRVQDIWRTMELKKLAFSPARPLKFQRRLR